MHKRIIIAEGLEAKYNNWHFSPAVESGGFVFVAGCTGAKLDGSISSNLEEQMAQAFSTVEMSLSAVGLSFLDVVEMTTYHVGLRSHVKQFMLVKDQFIVEPYPAWTAVGVSELVVDGAVIEIKVTAKQR